MTPIHQQIIDTILERMHQRVQELIQACQPAGQTPIASPTKEQLRQTLLGQHLAALAHYVEGYPYPFEGDVRASVLVVARCLYGDPLARRDFACFPNGSAQISEAWCMPRSCGFMKKSALGNCSLSPRCASSLASRAKRSINGSRMG